MSAISFMAAIELLSFSCISDLVSWICAQEDVRLTRNTKVEDSKLS
jgi:hypothetical protein